MHGEHVVIPPEAGTYRGAKKTFSRVKGDGVICLTKKKIIFRPIIGAEIEIPAAQISGTKESVWFLTGAKNFKAHLILTTHDENEIGFFVLDNGLTPLNDPN